MRIEYSPTAGALYLRLQAGTVAKTVEIEEFVYVDVDAERSTARRRVCRC